MKPIAIFRHLANEGPGFLAEFLDEHAIPWQLICIDAGEVVPSSANEFSGLVFMGGPMSVNDDLPWIEQELKLIREAVAQDMPVLGHCLGGQLMSKALGGKVTRNPVKELGWGTVTVTGNEVAHNWFGDVQGFQAFHWHGETFSLPNNAIHLLASEHCLNQAYAIGKHLALQCHIEMTPEMIVDWSEVGTEEIAAAICSPGVQSAQLMQQQTRQHLPPLHQVATRLYTHWVNGLKN